MACISPPSRNQPLGRIVGDGDDTDSVIGSLSEPGLTSPATQPQDCQLQASSVLALIYCVCAHLLHNVPQLSLTCESSLKGSPSTVQWHPDTRATVNDPSEDVSAYQWQDLRLVRNSAVSSTTLVTQPSAQHLHIMDGSNRQNRFYDDRTRGNEQPRRGASEYGPNPDAWMRNNFTPGHTYYDNNLSGPGTSILGNPLSNDHRQPYRSHAFVSNVVRDGHGAIFGDVTEDLAREINRSNTIARMQSREIQSSPPNQTGPIRRAESTPVDPERERQERHALMQQAEEGRLEYNNNGGVNARTARRSLLNSNHGLFEPFQVRGKHGFWDTFRERSRDRQGR